MVENKFIKGSTSVLVGTSLVCGVGVASVSASENGGLFVDKREKTSKEEAVNTINNAIKDLNENGVEALGRVEKMLDSLRGSLYSLIEKVRLWFWRVILGKVESVEENPFSVVINAAESLGKVEKKIGDIKSIIKSPALSDERKVEQVKKGLEDVLRNILGTDSIKIADEIDKRTGRHTAYVKNRNGKALGGIITKYDESRVEKNKNKKAFSEFEFNKGYSAFLNAKELVVTYSNPILHVEGLSDEEKSLAVRSVMLLNVLLSCEDDHVAYWVIYCTGADAVRTIESMKSNRAFWIKEDMQRLCITIICVNNILDLADSLKKQGKLSEEQITEFERLRSVYDTIIKYWRNSLKSKLENRYNEEKISYAYDRLKTADFGNNDYKNEQKKDDEVFSNLEKQLSNLIAVS